MLYNEVSENTQPGWTTVASRQLKKALISVLCSSNLHSVAYHILPGRPDLDLEVTS